jgi:hypothetical protein
MVMRDSTTDVSTRVLDELSKTVLVVGELLDEVFESYDDFDGWVLEHLPLHPRTAERIRAMYHLHRFKSNGDLPAPWKALWSLEG